MQKNLTYALLLALALGLSACKKTPEDKMDSTKENVSEAMESLGDADDNAGEAIQNAHDAVDGQ